MSSRSHFAGFFVFLCMLTVWRLSPAFTQSGMALGAYGDAAGTTGWIWEIGRQFQQQGWAVFLDGDLLRSLMYGAGQMDPVPVVNPAWRLLYVFVSQLGLSAENNYDSVIAFQFLLAGVVGWFFAGSFGLRILWRYVFVFLMLSVHNTSFRITGHNGLVFAYGPMLALMASLKYAQGPSKLRALGLALALWFSLLSNEYLGYFSFWACLALIVAHDWRQLKEKPLESAAVQWRNFWPAGLSLVVLLCLSHPSVTLFKIVALFERWSDAAPQAHAAAPTARATNEAREFLLYGLKNPLALFDSWFIPLPETIAQKIYGRNTHEFTFRWGLVMPLFVYWAWRSEKRVSERIPYKTLIISVCVVTLLLGMRTDLGLSLGWLTRLFAPMFRVGVRAQFISLLCMILLFTLFCQWVWDHRDRFGGVAKVAVLLSLVTTLAAFDVARSGPVFGRHSVFPISPRTPLAADLSQYPRGMTLMLPDDLDHESEAYFLSTAHHMPVLNSNLGRLKPVVARAFFAVTKRPSELSRAQLEACGVRYLIVRNIGSPWSGWANVSGLRTISQNADGVVYELLNAHNWPTELAAVNRSGREQAIAESHSFLSSCAEPLVPNE